MSNINLNGVRVDDQTGRVSFSGVQSGIDTEGAVNNIVTARRIPIDRIETEIDRNREIIAGASDWRTLMTNLQSKASVLYGQISLDNGSDVFESKQAFANTTREDGATPSQPGAMIGVTLDNDAELGIQSFEILQRATQHEVAMATPRSLSGTPLTADSTIKFATYDPDVDPAGLVGPLNGADWDPFIEINLEATDRLVDIRDKINLANQGPNPSGVTAQLITTGADEGYLVLRADTAGEIIDWERDAVPVALAQLDIISVNTLGEREFSNETVPPGKARIALNDLLDAEQGVFSREIATAGDVVTTLVNQVEIQLDDVQLGSTSDAPLAAVVGPGAVRLVDILDAFSDAGDTGVTPGQYDAGVDTAGTSNGTNVPPTFPPGNVGPDGPPPNGVVWVDMAGGTRTAFIEIVQNPDGSERLHAFLSASNDYFDPDRIALNLDFSDFTPGTGATQLADALEMRPDPVIVERNTNQIDDLFKGVTLDLLKAEPGTEIELDIQRDLNSVKTAITDFVEAYNEVVRFGNLQRQTDPLTGAPVEDASLYQTSILGQTESLFELLASQTAQGIKGVDPTILPPDNPVIGLDFRTLAEIGIDLISLDESEANPLERKTLTIDDADLDNALLTNFEGVEQLFTTQIQSNQSQMVIQSFTGDTDFTNGGGIRIGLDNPATAVDETTIAIPGSDFTPVYQAIDVNGNPVGATFEFTVTASGQMIFDEGPAAGLRMFFTGNATTFGAFTVPPEVTMTKGIGNNFFFGLDRLTDPDIGSLSSEIDAREADNELKRTRVEEQLERLDRERIRLTEQFNRMEAALAQLESLQQQVAAAFGETGSE